MPLKDTTYEVSTKPFYSGADQENDGHLTVHIANATPSWKIPGDGKGVKSLKVRAVARNANGGKFVEINTTEIAMDHSGKTRSIRETYVTLDEKTGQVLYEQLHKVFGRTD